MLTIATKIETSKEKKCWFITKKNKNSHFANNILKYIYFVTNPFFLKRKLSKKSIKILPKISTIAYNMKGRLRFSTFIILNIAKFG
jgi:hypothetical protein